jgi:Flp pilus assembly protein TadB
VQKMERAASWLEKDSTHIHTRARARAHTQLTEKRNTRKKEKRERREKDSQSLKKKRKKREKGAQGEKRGYSLRCAAKGVPHGRGRLLIAKLPEII